MMENIKNGQEILHGLIRNAFHEGASDIHIDPYGEGIRVRFRIDGILTYRQDVLLSAHSELIARVKVLAGLRTDVHNSAHDGRFSFDSTDIRVSIIPTRYGENVVLRLLPVTDGPISLSSLGFSENDVNLLRSFAHMPNGMILVTGPTGSGKTSTQYGLVSEMRPDSQSIVTLEDPIEYALPGVRQIQVNEKHGLSFAKGLRAILRQDPDVIMVGEIRDTETSQIAVNAALTGHLIISTLHTSSAVDVIHRLMNMGVEPYLIASTLSLVVAQRLVRKLCVECGGVGCAPCRQTGYKGRTTISEILPIDKKIRKHIVQKLSREDIIKYIRSTGMKTMLEDGLEKVEQGITSEAEVRRVLQDTYEENF